jgi:hypothetical protein
MPMPMPSMRPTAPARRVAEAGGVRARRLKATGESSNEIMSERWCVVNEAVAGIGVGVQLYTENNADTRSIRTQKIY